MGHEVLHAYAAALQTPRGDLQKSEADAASLTVREVAMDPLYTKYKYSFVRRRNMEVAYGKRVVALIRTWKPEGVISGNTPTETQESIVRASQDVKARFVYWVQDFYSIAVDKLVRKKIPVFGGIIGNYYRRMEGRQLRASHRVVAITEDFSPILRDDYQVDGARIAVIPNWAPLENLPVCDKNNAWSQRHGLQDKFVYLYTGTLGMKHNPELLLGLARQYQANDQIRVVVISEGIGAEWLADKKKEVYDGDLIALVETVVRGTTVSVWKLDYLHTASASGAGAGTGAMATATVRLTKDDKTVTDAATGDGPVDAVVSALNRITGVTGMVEDYRLRAVTKGGDALGEVSLRAKLSLAGGEAVVVGGKGLSTDIVHASCLAYLDAVNRIGYHIGRIDYRTSAS